MTSIVMICYSARPMPNIPDPIPEFLQRLDAWAIESRDGRIELAKILVREIEINGSRRAIKDLLGVFRVEINKIADSESEVRDVIDYFRFAVGLEIQEWENIIRSRRGSSNGQ